MATHTRPIATRIVALAITMGAAFMFGRTLVLIAGGALALYTWWAAGLLLAESLIDLFTLAAAARWLATSSHQATALQGAVAIVMVHAVRVAVFVLGRTGPWVDFDIRPADRLDYADRWTWAGVYFAGVMAVLSVVVTIGIWLVLRRTRSRTPERPLPSPPAASR